MPFIKDKYNMLNYKNSDIDIRKINLEPKLQERLIFLMQKENERICTLANSLQQGKDLLKNENDMVRLAVVVKCLEKTKTFYGKLGIDDNIFYETMSDIKIWCENNGNNGLKNYRWLTTHINGEIFKIGRLQYQMYVCDSEDLDYSRLPFNRGEKVLYIHIPQGEKLKYSECVKSIKLAKEFFNKYFYDFTYRYFFCESWLLYEENGDFMKKDSNILKFVSLFDIAYSVKDDKQAIERIFGKEKNNMADYPENTSLQKAAKEYMQNGHNLGMGIGTIKA